MNILLFVYSFSSLTFPSREKIRKIQILFAKNCQFLVFTILSSLELYVNIQNRYGEFSNFFLFLAMILICKAISVFKVDFGALQNFEDAESDRASERAPIKLLRNSFFFLYLNCCDLEFSGP
jgi:hypothetical protein